MPKIFYDGKIINTISMNPSSSTHYLIEGMKKIKKTECLVIPFEKTDIVKYDNGYYQITDDAKINNNKIYYSISNLLKKKDHSKIKHYETLILRKKEFLNNNNIINTLCNKINEEIKNIRKEIEKEKEKDEKKIVESNKLIELNKSISIEIKKYATHINSYNNCWMIRTKFESIDFVMDLFKEIKLSCNKIDEIKNRIYFTKNVKYEINNIIINPFEFIEEDWQLFNYNKALSIETIYEIESSDEIRRNAWFYSFIHSVNTFYIPINDFEINYNHNTCTIYKNSKKVNVQTLIENNIFCLKIINGKEYITTKFLMNYEKSLGDLFLELFHDKNTEYEKILDIDIDEYIEEYQQLPGKNVLNEYQRNAVKTCLLKKLSVITGFPGTGKTTIVDCILYILKKLGLKNISLCAPTGKAYNNMNKKTKQYDINKYNCGTLHKVIYTSFNDVENSSDSGSDSDSDDTPNIEFVFIDEISMVDIFMFKNLLLRAKTFGFQLILIGDKNQLPSVGPGTILKNIIESGIFLDNTTTLTEICRQSDGSLVNVIKKLANKDLFSIKDFDGNTLKFIPLYHYKDKENYIQNKIVSFNHDNHLDYNNTKYLVYDNKTVTILNNILQIQFNENLSEITPPPYSTHSKQIFKVKDRIILKHNETQTSRIINNDDSIKEEGKYRANGDEATIYSYDNSKKIVSLFYEGDGDELTEISVTDLYELYDLSYCLTIHKSQGSQYENIVLILDNSYNMTKNALFTAISRAEKKCFIFARDKNDIISIQYKEESNKISLFLEEFNDYELQ